ncbi:MAG: hypothetical protein ACYC36_03825 [Bellilinea sp.]
MGHSIELAVMSEMLDDEVRAHAATRKALEKAAHDATVRAEKAEKQEEKLEQDLAKAKAAIADLEGKMKAEKDMAEKHKSMKPEIKQDDPLINELRASLKAEQNARAESEKRFTAMMERADKPMTISMPAHKPTAYKMVVTGRDGNNDIRTVSIVPEK